MVKHLRLAAFLATGADPDHPEERALPQPTSETLRRLRACALVKAHCPPDQVERAMERLREVLGEDL